jgi:organic hydroperoxide reductase OsmC/OhrA
LANTLYTAKAHVTGGRAEGHGSTDDGQLDVQLRLPSQMGEGALGVVARRMKAEAGDVEIDSGVSLSPDGKGGFLLSVTLDVSLPSVSDAAEAAELVRAAHQVCPYSNATRGNIDVALTANGQPVE